MSLQNIGSLFFSQHGALRDEFGFLYESLFRNASEHIHIVEALSKKKSGMTRDEIAAAANQKPGGNLKIRLEELEQCDFIRKYLPPDRKNRGAVFQLMDNFTLFHYAFASARVPIHGGRLRQRTAGRADRPCRRSRRRNCQSLRNQVFDRSVRNRRGGSRAAEGQKGGVHTRDRHAQDVPDDAPLHLDRHLRLPERGGGKDSLFCVTGQICSGPPCATRVNLLSYPHAPHRVNLTSRQVILSVGILVLRERHAEEAEATVAAGIYKEV